jgi:hypothetical protein
VPGVASVRAASGEVSPIVQNGPLPKKGSELGQHRPVVSHGVPQGRAPLQHQTPSPLVGKAWGWLSRTTRSETLASGASQVANASGGRLFRMRGGALPVPPPERLPSHGPVPGDERSSSRAPSLGVSSLRLGPGCEPGAFFVANKIRTAGSLPSGQFFIEASNQKPWDALGTGCITR